MRDLTPYESDCIARLILKELKRVARRSGAIKLDDKIKLKVEKGEAEKFEPAYPYLALLLDCDCGEAHADDALRRLIDLFYVQDWHISDGLPLTYRQLRQALHHIFFSFGSLDEKRQFVISAIFGVENQNKKSPKYRKGWDIGTYRRTKEDQVLLAFARFLTDHLYLKNEPDPVESAEFDFELAELDLMRNDDEAA